MAGHSKWNNIKHKKKAEDAKKSKLYTKFSQEINRAFISKSDKLSQIIQEAKKMGVPQQVIDKATSINNFKEYIFEIKINELFGLLFFWGSNKEFEETRNFIYKNYKTVKAQHKFITKLITDNGDIYEIEDKDILKEMNINYTQELIGENPQEYIIDLPGIYKSLFSL